MLHKTQIQPIGANEKLLMALPYCSCNACKNIYEDLKTKIDKKRFFKLDIVRVSKYK